MLILCVAKRATMTTFVVERTNYGWSVGAGTERIGLFVTQRQALDGVKKRRVELTAKGATQRAHCNRQRARSNWQPNLALLLVSSLNAQGRTIRSKTAAASLSRWLAGYFVLE